MNRRRVPDREIKVRLEAETLSLPLIMEHIEDLINAYLEILPCDDGTEIYGSYRQIAEDELAGFVRWLKAECNED